MHIPPAFKRPAWQRFLLGAATGVFFAYLILLFMYGEMYEQLMHENNNLQSVNRELTNHNQALLKDQEEAEERENKPYTVERIQLTIENDKELRLDRLATHQLEQLLIDEMDVVIGSSVSSVAENNALLIAAIENRTFSVDDFSYSFTVKKFILYSSIVVTVEATLET